MSNRTRNRKRHWDVLTYCTLCSKSISQNFSLNYIQENKNSCLSIDIDEVCPYSIKNTDSICIPFIIRGQPKYPNGFYYFPKDDKFFSSRDFMHLFFLPLSDIYIPHLFTFTAWLLLFMTIFIIVIPEIIFILISKRRTNLILRFLSNGYRNLSILWLLLSQLLLVASFTLYSIGILNFTRLKTELIFGVIFTLFLSLICYVGIISLWVHILEQSDHLHKVNVSTKNK